MPPGNIDDMSTIVHYLESNEESFSYLNLSMTLLSTYQYVQIHHLLPKNKTIHTINLSYNKLDNEFCKYFKDVLKHNHIVESLDLSSNEIKLEGLKLLCNGLRFNQGLSEFFLIDNEMEDGEEALNLVRKVCRQNIVLQWIQMGGIGISDEFKADTWGVLEGSCRITW